jgi:hypothetical protein
MPPSIRGAAANLALELDNTIVGRLMSADLGLPVGVGSTEPGPLRIGGVKQTAAVVVPTTSFTCGAGMASAVYDWLGQAFSYSESRKGAAVITFDNNGEILHRLEFASALIAEVGFPALDGSSKEAARLSVKIAPEVARFKRDSGSISLGIYSSPWTKPWMASDFRLMIDGLDTVCKRVSRIEPLTTTIKIVADTVGHLRDYELHTGSLQYPNLVISFPKAVAQPMLDWHQSFVIDGKNGPGQEKSGKLEFLDPKKSKVYFTIEFKGLGLVNVVTQPSANSSDGVSMVKAEMYVEEMGFKYDG